MRRAFAVLLFVAACGRGGDDSSPGEIARDAAPRPTRRHAVEESAPALTAGEIDALLAEWDSAKDESAKRRLRAKLVAGGDAVADRLVARLVASSGDGDACGLLRDFGMPAVTRLLAALPKAQGRLRWSIVERLDELSPSWQADPLGPDVCRALVPLVFEEENGWLARSALAKSRPAGRAVAKEIAEAWLREPRSGVAYNLLEVLKELGPDAAPATPLLVAHATFARRPRTPDEDRELPEDQDEYERSFGAQSVLRRIEPDPSLVEAMRKLLSCDQPGEARAGAASVLGAWGDAAAAAVTDLLAMLADPDDDHDVPRQAAAALLAMPSKRDAVWDAIRQAYARGDAWTHALDETLTDVSRDAFFRPRLIELLPTLAPSDLVQLQEVLARHGARDLAGVAPALLTSPDARVRRIALAPWRDADEKTPLPEGAARLLDDPDAAVRAAAASILAARGGLATSRVREVAGPLLASSDPELRVEAVRALGAVANSDSAARDAVVAELDRDAVPRVRLEAARALANDDARIDGAHDDAVWWISTAFENGRDDATAFAHTLLRFHGGDEALVKAAEAVVGREGIDVRPWIDAIVVAGPRAAALKARLLERRATTGNLDRDEIDRALAAIDADPDAIALTTRSVDAALVTRLLAMGDAGRRALLLANWTWWPTDDLRTRFAGTSMQDLIVAGAHPAADDPHAAKRREGAAFLSRLLPPAKAVEICSSLVDSTDAAARTLHDVATETPDAVPVALVRRMLDGRRGADGSIVGRRDALSLAGDLGPRAAELVPDIRKLRDGDALDLSADAAVALWSITKSVDETLPALRRVLAETDGTAASNIDWESVAPVLGELPFDKTDLARILGAMRRVSDTGVDRNLAPLLERFGPDAAPAIPALRRIVCDRDEAWSCCSETEPDAGERAARVLAAIGAAARDVVPDLRNWIREVGDPHGVGRDAIAKIEAASR